MSIKKAATSMGVALAMSAAGLVGTTSIASAGSGSDVKCYGVNKCGGHNDCKTASNACKGKAACQGQGFVKMPASSCDHMGGEVK